MPFRIIAAPFTAMDPDGNINLQIIDAQAQLLHEGGVLGVFVAGSTGEGMSLTVDERIQLADRWNQLAPPLGLEVIIQVGHTSQQDAISLASHAADIGVDAIAIAPPSYFKPTTIDELLGYCVPIAEEASLLPVFYYDIPGLTGVQLPMVEFLSRGKRQMPNLVGIKYSNPDIVQLQECVRLNNGEFELLFGCDQALLAGYVLGACGAVGSTYNFAAPLYHKMLDAFEAGDHAEARRLQAISVSIVRTMEAYSFIPAAKYAMTLLGIDCGPVRPPFPNLTADQKEQLCEQLENIGFQNVCRVEPVA